MSEKDEMSDVIDIIAAVIVDKRGADVDGIPRIGRQTHKKAVRVIKALASAGWRVVPDGRRLAEEMRDDE